MEPVLPLLPLAPQGFATDQLELTVLKLVRQKSQGKQMKRLLLINLFFFFSSAFADYIPPSAPAT